MSTDREGQRGWSSTHLSLTTSQKDTGDSLQRPVRTRGLALWAGQCRPRSQWHSGWASLSFRITRQGSNPALQHSH